MVTFLARRLLAAALTLFVIASLCFLLTRLAPGSPFASERAVSAEVRKNLEVKYGTDRPWHVQYVSTLWHYVCLDFGLSWKYTDRSVSELLLPAIRTSATLGSLAFCFSFLVGLPLGVLAAARQHRIEDHATMALAVAGICVPNFLLGPLLVLLFCSGLRVLPAAGWPGNWLAWSELRKLVMPGITLSLVHIAYISRLARAGMLDVLHKDFIRTARAKGLSELVVVLKHALRNGIVPVVSYAGPMAALVITGSVVVEQIFVIPGLGQHFVKAAFNRDAPLLMGAVLIYSSLVIGFNILVDLSYGWLDPRVRIG